MPLPQPTLARSGAIPPRAEYAYEVKWDGVRELLTTQVICGSRVVGVDHDAAESRARIVPDLRTP
jgi:hypothetical protein